MLQVQYEEEAVREQCRDDHDVRCLWHFHIVCHYFIRYNSTQVNRSFCIGEITETQTLLLIDFTAGAMHFFEKMNVGPLKLGDYLGNSLLFFNLETKIPLITCVWTIFCFVAAIGAIFSATDSVCTLQVLCLSMCWSFLTRETWQILLTFLNHIYHYCRSLIRMTHHCCTAWFLGKG